jgi:hypothetical protein
MQRLVQAATVILIALVPSCGNDIAANTENTWIGTWRFSSQQCSGLTYVVTGISRVTLVLGETKGTTVVEYANGCTVRMEDYLITPVGGGRFEFPTITSERVVCDPNPCTGEQTVIVGGDSSIHQQTCPDDFPPLATGLSPGRVEGNFIIADVDLGDGVNCTLRYASE